MDLTAPQVTAVNLTPPAPVKLGPLAIQVQFNERINPSSNPVRLTLKPFSSETEILLSSTSLTWDAWSGIIVISTSISEGLATLTIRGGEDLSGNPLPQKSTSFLIDYTPPSAPPTVSAVPQNNGVDIFVSWPASESAIGYSVYRSTLMEGPFLRIQSGIGALSVVDSPEAMSSVIYYGVSALDASGNESPRSPVVSVITPLVPAVTSPVDNERFSTSTITIQGRAQAKATVSLMK